MSAAIGRPPPEVGQTYRQLERCGHGRRRAGQRVIRIIEVDREAKRIRAEVLTLANGRPPSRWDAEANLSFATLRGDYTLEDRR